MPTCAEWHAKGSASGRSTSRSGLLRPFFLTLELASSCRSTLERVSHAIASNGGYARSCARSSFRNYPAVISLCEHAVKPTTRPSPSSTNSSSTRPSSWSSSQAGCDALAIDLPGSGLPGGSIAPAALDLPLLPELLGVCRRGTPATWRAAWLQVDPPSPRALPSVSSRWLRPGALTLQAING